MGILVILKTLINDLRMKNFLLSFLFFASTLSSLAQIPKDSLDHPIRILILDTLKIPLEESKEYNFITVEWIEKMEIIKDEKYKDIYGDKNGTLYIYIKKKYFKKIKRKLGIN